VAEAAFGAELVTGVQGRGQVAAVRRTTMLTGGRAQLDLAVHVIGQPGVADLAVHPDAVAIPAGEQTGGGVLLGEVATAVAEVGAEAAEAGETAEHHAVAGPVDTEQAGRGQAVVQVGVVVALQVAAHATPPGQAVSRTTAQVHADLVGTRAADGLCRVAQHLLQARASSTETAYWPSS
jgi:hypothetical protein